MELAGNPPRVPRKAVHGKVYHWKYISANHLRWVPGEVARTVHWRMCEHARSQVLAKLPEGAVCAEGAGPGEATHAAWPDAGENIRRKCPCSGA